ncbi:MAG TPA: MFS transporter [Anaerolineales bacterium]|nr:MFS transporter [Anaerolineales bacterium]
MFSKISRTFKQVAVPPEYHANFRHLYFDIAGFGILSGSVINFLNIYATRLGATSFQIGMIGAMSALVNLFLAIPAGRWLSKRNTSRAIFRSSVYYRIGFLFFIFIPQFFNDAQQIVAIILITLLMAIPLTPLGVGFNALFAEAVPDKYRAHVAGTRNVVLAVTYIVASLISGFILDSVAFPTGYQIVFGIGAFGAALSSYHLYFIKPVQDEDPTLQSTLEPDPAKKVSLHRKFSSALRMDILSTPFTKVLLALFAFHFTHTLTAPIYPLYNVRVLNLNDNNLGISQALYYLTMLFGSMQFRRMVGRFGHKKVTGFGVIGMSLYPLLLAFTTQLWQFYAIALIGGFTWAWTNGAYANYMLERIPPADRPSHLAWYTIILNIAILSGSLGGSAIADNIGLVSALLLFGTLRIFAGLYILKWG